MPSTILDDGESYKSYSFLEQLPLQGTHGHATRPCHEDMLSFNMLSSYIVRHIANGVQKRLPFEGNIFSIHMTIRLHNIWVTIVELRLWCICIQVPCHGVVYHCSFGWQSTPCSWNVVVVRIIVMLFGTHSRLSIVDSRAHQIEPCNWNNVMLTWQRMAHNS